MLLLHSWGVSSDDASDAAAPAHDAVGHTFYSTGYL